MGKITRFKTAAERIDEKYQDEHDKVSGDLNQIHFKIENTGVFSEEDFDKFLLGLYQLGNITNAKVDEKLAAGIITKEEAEKMYR